MTGVANGFDGSSADAELRLTFCSLAVHGGTSAPLIMQVHPDRRAWEYSESPALSTDTCHNRQLVESSQEHACTQEAWDITLR